MSKLNIDQKTIKDLFEDKKADFLIPDYQRPYAWEETECQTLWDDLKMFAFPDDDCDKFNSNDEYFLGPIVTFKNDQEKKEIIDGQQRLTTLMLLLRAFYSNLGQMQSDKAKKTRTFIERCIWKTDEFGDPIKDALKIDSEVASDNDKEEFLNILRTGKASDNKNRYALNYLFFQNLIAEFQKNFPDYFSLFPLRILNNCILLPIEAESQDTALRIFSTLNDRGKPLSDADIFKAQLYKYYAKKGEKDSFIQQWKNLEELCEKMFHPISGTPMDELFTRYMYYERAKSGIKTSTTEALRKFYEKENYKILKNESTFNNLQILASFWKEILTQNDEMFSSDVLRQLFVLNHAPNGMWCYFLSVYYMHNKDVTNKLDNDKLLCFLKKITGFIWAYAFTNPGLNSLRTPVFTEMINIVENRDVTFEGFKFEKESLKTTLNNYKFTNARQTTKSMLAWWAFENENQELLSIDTTFEIEHIFAKNRQDHEKSLKNNSNIDSIGNKSLLEKTINIRASDYKFSDKVKYYEGFITSKNKQKDGTKIKDLLDIAKIKNDFVEIDIENRKKLILDSFVSYLEKEKLISTP